MQDRREIRPVISKPMKLCIGSARWFIWYSADAAPVDCQYFKVCTGARYGNTVIQSETSLLPLFLMERLQCVLCSSGFPPRCVAWSFCCFDSTLWAHPKGHSLYELVCNYKVKIVIIILLQISENVPMLMQMQVGIRLILGLGGLTHHKVKCQLACTN